MTALTRNQECILFGLMEQDKWYILTLLLDKVLEFPHLPCLENFCTTHVKIVIFHYTK